MPTQHASSRWASTVWHRFLRRYTHNRALKLGYTWAEIKALKSRRAVAQWTDRDSEVDCNMGRRWYNSSSKGISETSNLKQNHGVVDKIAREMWKRRVTWGQVSNAARSRNSLELNTIMAFFCKSHLNFFAFTRQALGILQYIGYRIGCIVALQHWCQQSCK